ncbi:MAG: T9SS type A sorting domain-containing protein [Ignavibacteria bacterium]|nr:T9SS type A sorting domain-containing protein [Ignavibacteria bacterium]
MKNIFFYVLMFSFLVVVSFVIRGEQLHNNNSQQNYSKPVMMTPISWINLDGLPPVGDQVVGGSCYAWAAAYYYLTHLQWQEYGWDVNDPAHQFSPAFVYNLTNGGVDNGAWEGENARHDAFEVMRTLGCATMEDMPYSYTAYRTFPSETAFRYGIKFRTLSTHHIETRTDSGLQVLKDHLVNGNLAVMGIYGYQNLNNINSYNNIYCQSQVSGGRLYWHEVTVVGYNDTLVTADGIGAFRLINEWGTEWGDNGFFWMSYEAVKHTQTSYGYVMYATDRIGYEPLLTSRVEVGHSDRYNLVYRAGFGEVSSPDTLLTLFDFSPMSLSSGIPYPDESTLVLDLTDMADFVQSSGSNNIFIRIEDDAPNNTHSGFIKSLTIEDLSEQLCIQSLNIPIVIDDVSIGVEEVIDLNYSLSSPQGFNINPIPMNGMVQLSWSAPVQPGNLEGYRIYLNGRLIDTTTSLAYNHFLSLRGNVHYDVTAVFSNGESLGAMKDALWEGPNAFGIPFTDNFEYGFGEWYQIGISGIPSLINDDSVFEGQYSAGIKSTEFDNTALLRPFETTEGVSTESWFKMETFSMGNMGAGGCVFLLKDGLILGTFFDPNGHPGYVYTIVPGNPIPVHLDSLVTIDPNEWYKQKIWYYNGKLQFMLINSEWTVILNRAVNIPVQSLDQVALFVQGLDNGWNYFDKFEISPWDDNNYTYFNPVNTTDNPYGFIISEASVDTSILQVGDEIAVYDGDLCVGAVIVDGDWPLEMNAWEADSVNPGFISGNSISARMWSNQTNLEYETDIIFEIGNGSFGDGIYSRISISGTNIVGIPNDGISLPTKFSLSQNYPNPFNPSTMITFTIAANALVTLKVFDVLGQEVMTLINQDLTAGVHTYNFDAAGFNSGVYFYRIEANGIDGTNFTNVKKMILLH